VHASRADIRDSTGVSYVLISHDLAVVRQLAEHAIVCGAAGAVSGLSATSVRAAGRDGLGGSRTVFRWGRRFTAANLSVCRRGHPATRTPHDDALSGRASCAW
jgi:hypothetical protein